MARNRSLSFVTATAVALALVAGVSATGVSAQEGTEVVSEAARQVTDDPNPTRLYVTPQVAVRPDDPDTLVVAAGDVRAGGCSLWASRDGGLSWAITTDALLPDTLDYCVQNNQGRYISPVFATDGTLYVGMSGSSVEEGHPDGPITALVARTTDLGRTHETFVVAAAEEVEATTEDGQPVSLVEQHRYSSLAVDPNDPEQLYAGWRLGLSAPPDVEVDTPPTASTVATSSDGGQSWSEPVNLFKAVDEVVPEGSSGSTPNLVVAPDGTVHAFTRVSPPSPDDDGPSPPTLFVMFTSTDAGATWSAQQVYQHEHTLDNPQVAVDPQSGALHLAWLQRDRDRPAPLVVYAMASTDGGAAWSEPVRVTDEDAAEDYNQYLPGISVAPDGRVDVAWHDFRNDPFFPPGGFVESGSEEQRYSDVYYSFSTDGGATWSADVRASDRLIDRGLGVSFTGFDIRGPIGVASAPDAAYLVWPDTRAAEPVAQAEDAYFTRIRLDAGAASSASGDRPVLWSLLGAAGALALGGLVLLVTTSAIRRRRLEVDK